jgi:hypothetical protein
MVEIVTTAVDAMDSSSSEDEMQDFEPAPSVPRPPSEYLLFSASVRDAVRAENPGVPLGRIAGLIAERWNGLTPAERQPFVAERARRMLEWRRLRDAALAGTC